VVRVEQKGGGDLQVSSSATSQNLQICRGSEICVGICRENGKVAERVCVCCVCVCVRVCACVCECVCVSDASFVMKCRVSMHMLIRLLLCA